jgi:hypothetical protein
LAAWLPVLLLLHCQVPHKPGMTALLGHCCRMLRAGKQPKSAHSSNLGVATDNLLKGEKRHFLPRIKPGISTPQI